MMETMFYLVLLEQAEEISAASLRLQRLQEPHALGIPIRC